MSIVDANIILRYLLDDHADLSPKAAEILEQQTVTMPIEVACEVVYVLQKVYAVVDTLLWAYHTVEQQEIFTFDDKLRKYIKQTGTDAENFPGA